MKKYIVYLTINTKNNKIYVGVHKCNNTDKFDGYIGCGVNINDSHSYKKSKTPFQHAVNKHGINAFKRITLREFDTLEEAIKLETIIVNKDFIERRDTYNVALGGGVPPDPSKITYQYELDGDFIKEWDSINDAANYYNVSNSSIGRAIIDKTVSVNYLWTDYKVSKLDITTFKFANNKKAVHKYDISGKYVESFDSICSAAKKEDVLTSSIAMSIKGGYKSGNYYYSEVLQEKFDVARKVDMSTKNVHKYNLLGEYIESFSTIKSGADSVGITPSRITASIRTGGLAGKHQWSFEKVEKMKPLKSKQYVARKIGQYTMDGELVKIYNTVTECKKDFCGCTHVLKGTRKSSGGFSFKYMEEENL